MSTTRYNTDQEEFKKFLDLLTEDHPDYEPWLFPLNIAEKDPLDGQGWKAIQEHRVTDKRPVDKYRINKNQCMRFLEDHGNNIGIAGTQADSLLIIDVDDIEAFKDHDFKPTLTAVSGSRLGKHYYYRTKDARCKVNVPLEDEGEIRSDWQYVVAPGSFAQIVDSIDKNGNITETREQKLAKIPEYDRENAGKYTILDAIAPAWITYEELPEKFRIHLEATEEAEREAAMVKANRPTRKHDNANVNNRSRLYELEIGDIINIPDDDRRHSSAFHDSHTGANSSVSKGLHHCWRHYVTHNAVQAIAVEMGLYSCAEAGTPHKGSKAGPSTIDYQDGETMMKIWTYAKENGYIPKDDPMPAVVLTHLACVFNVCKKDEIIDGWKLPKGCYKQVLDEFKKAGIETGRESTKERKLHEDTKNNSPEEEFKEGVNGNEIDTTLSPLEYARAALKLEDVPEDGMERISAAELFIGSYTIEMTEAEREYFAENAVKDYFNIEKISTITKMLTAMSKRLKPSKSKTKKNTIQQPQGQYANLARVQENGKVKLMYPEIADMLSEKYDIIAYGGEISVYDDGFYKNGETIVKQEITRIARAVNFEDGIKTPTEEVIHYVAYDDPCEMYPFNVQDNAINVKNGVVVIDFDKETFELVEHDPKFKFNYKYDIKFNPENENDTIHNDVICKYVEPKDVDLLYQIVAQALLQMLGSAPFKKSYILQGDPDAGKSAFLELLLQTFGQKTHSQVALQDICNNRFALANLEGKLLNTYDDLSEMQLSNTGKFKAVTGKEDHEIERKGKQGYTARLTAVHVYTCNSPPAFDKRIQNDTAFWGRWEYIHFPYHFERDAFFYQRMFTPENLEGFFMKILGKVIKIRREGLQVNSTPGEVREKWSFNSDPLYQFITLNMEPSEREITLNKDEFWEAYKRWCVSTDVDNAKIIMSKKAFTISLDKYGFVDRKVTTAKYGRIKCYQGMFNWQPENKYGIGRVELKTEQGSL